MRRLPLLLAFALLSPSPAWCQGERDLPQPLDLAAALSMAEEASHPDLARAQAALDRADAGRLEAASSTGLNVTLDARAGLVEPSDVAADQSRGDHRAGLRVSKRLYDFGYSQALVRAAEEDLTGSRSLYLDARQRRRLAVMEHFFDVLLADLTYARDNELMAAEFVEYDRLTTRHELGQASDVALFEAESRYQEARARRARGAVQQRVTRARLALDLNRPGRLPGDLTPPDLPEPELPPVEDLQAAARRDNPVVAASRARLAAAQARVEAARARYGPRLDAEVEAAAYARELGSSDPLRAAVVLSVPLYRGGAEEAAIAAARADLETARAELEEERREVEQQVLETWLEAQTLIEVDRERVRVFADYRDIVLDRARTEYALEFRADLGDSMAQTSEARLRDARVRYTAALALARLKALAGRLPGASFQGEESARTATPK